MKKNIKMFFFCHNLSCIIIMKMKHILFLEILLNVFFVVERRILTEFTNKKCKKSIYDRKNMNFAWKIYTEFYISLLFLLRWAYIN